MRFGRNWRAGEGLGDAGLRFREVGLERVGAIGGSLIGPLLEVVTVAAEARELLIDHLAVLLGQTELHLLVDPAVRVLVFVQLELVSFFIGLL